MHICISLAGFLLKHNQQLCPKDVQSVSNIIDVTLEHLITTVRIPSQRIVRRDGPFLLKGIFSSLIPGVVGKCQPMTFSLVKGTSVHLLCSSQLSDHLPNPVWASLPYVRRPSDDRTLCETNTKRAPWSSRSGRCRRKEKDKMYRKWNVKWMCASTK